TARRCATAWSASGSATSPTPTIRVCSPTCSRQRRPPRPGLLSRRRGVARVDLLVERPVVVEHAEQERAAGEQIQDAGDPLALVEAVDAEDAEEGQQDPRDRVIDVAAAVA